uniref:Regulator of G protein signaling 9 binding protein n=1 Tax=Paramormyrops kingsleyae TaxID=1676925 RepID=A0A3B3S310_9TELE|nr:regulator of G-protein signaling 9-binding protein B-like [Paramormyrops kingsleyae]
MDGKVADDGGRGSQKLLEEVRALVETLNKVVACYHQLSSCVGGSTDSGQLRHELRQTRERAQQLALDSRRLLTARLRDRSLAPPTRLEAELLWVSFSSSLELLHADMCKVFSVGQNFPLSSNTGVLVQTGMQGETAKVTARALSLSEPDLNEAPASMDRLEQGELEAEKARVDQMIEDMEQRVNVLRWTVEAQGPQNAEPVGSGSSLALLSVLQAEPEQHRCKRGQMFVAALVVSLAAAALLLSVGVLYLG